MFMDQKSVSRRNNVWSTFRIEMWRHDLGSGDIWPVTFLLQTVACTINLIYDRNAIGQYYKSTIVVKANYDRS